MFAISDYDYRLPKNLIAQTPAGRRDQSRLLYLDRAAEKLSHHRFSNLPELLQPSDLLVINDTQVIPARLFGKKETGGRVEVLIIDYASAPQRQKSGHPHACECLIRASKAPKPGTRIDFGPDLKAVVKTAYERTFLVEFTCARPFEELIEQIGVMPLPPYIKRRHPSERAPMDKISYQTVYAANKGAVAAPTAGLHFSEELLQRLRHKGIEIVAITLHVGYGTFMPVRVADIRKHKIHAEAYRISASAAQTINAARAEGRRIVTVGTTTVRTLEYATGSDGTVTPGTGICDLFIYPGYQFKITNAMITNFHLPKSTLLMLVAAFAGLDRIREAYAVAIEEGYRFYSYGDAMLIA
jgi:S-adenosylmethionine:tRNA ribosyltransferase-isomerase